MFDSKHTNLYCDKIKTMYFYTHKYKMTIRMIYIYSFKYEILQSYISVNYELGTDKYRL